MAQYEYRVIPAPTKGQKAQGVKGAEARYAFAIEDLMNRMGADGWEYQRSDTLPMEVREGLTGTATKFQTLLVFRRATGVEATKVAAPAAQTETPAQAPAQAPAPAPVATAEKVEGTSDAAATAAGETLLAATKITSVQATGPKLGSAKAAAPAAKQAAAATPEKEDSFEPDEPVLPKESSPNSVLLSRAQRIFSRSDRLD